MKKQSYTISELLAYLSSRESKLESVSSRKKYITLCNSLSIKLIQSKSYQNAMLIITKGIFASKALEFSDLSNKLWPGRILTLNILSFIYYKIEKFTEGLKILYESHNLLQTSKENFNSYNVEIYILTNFLTVLCLWKIDRKSEAKKYLDIVKSKVLNIRTGKNTSNLSSTSIDNLYGVVIYIFSILIIELEGNFKFAERICEETIEKIGVEIVSREFIRSLITKIKAYTKNPYEGIDLEFFPELEEIFFISIFLPMISPNTPQIKESERFKISRKSSSGSKRTSSSSTKVNEFSMSRGNISPLNRPFSGIKSESHSNTGKYRPKSSCGAYTKKRISRIYLQ